MFYIAVLLRLGISRRPRLSLPEILTYCAFVNADQTRGRGLAGLNCRQPLCEFLPLIQRDPEFGEVWRLQEGTARNQDAQRLNVLTAAASGKLVTVPS